MKKLLALILIAALAVTTLCFNAVTVSAGYYNTKDVSYYVEDGEAIIYYLPSEKIPTKIDGYPVTTILKYGNVVDEQLEDDQLGAIHEIGETLNIPEGIKRIGDFAFQWCDAKNITLPDSLEYIGPFAFDSTDYYKDKSNWKDGVLYIGKHLIKADESLSGEYKIKEGTLTIAAEAFSECTNLTTIIVPNSVKNICNPIFGDLEVKSPKKIKISDENKNFYVESGVIYNKDLTEVIAASPSTMGNITLHKTVKKIHDYAFHNCNLIKSIKLQNGVEKIGDYAFVNCKSLEKINLPDSVKEVGAGIVNNTKYFDTNSNWKKDVLYINKHLITATIYKHLCTYQVKDGTLTIADSAFELCDMEEVTMPDSVTYIGNRAFEDCEDLKSVKLSKNLTKIGNYAFYECKKLKSIKLPSKVKDIGISAFYECENLTKINIPAGVTTINNYTFEDCDKLKTITIPETVTRIGRAAFYSSDLEKISLPKNLKIINKVAFGYCDLKEITLTKNLKTVGEKAFYECSELKTVYFIGTKDDHQKINIHENNSEINSISWTYKPQKETTSSENETTSSENETTSSKNETTSSKNETTSSKNETISQNNENTISQPETETESTVSTDNESTVSTETESTPSPENETENNDMKKPDVKPKNNTVTVLIITGSILLCIAGGFSAFFIRNKKKK